MSRHVKSVSLEILTKDKGDPVGQTVRPRYVQNVPPLRDDPDLYARVGKRESNDGIHAMGLFGGISFHEFFPCGGGMENIGHPYRCPNGTPGIDDLFNTPPADHRPRPRRRPGTPRQHLDSGYGCNACEGLAPKAEGADSVDIVEGIYLARGVPLKGKGNLVPIDPSAVVYHPNRSFSPSLQFDKKIGSPRIEGVFYQFLDDGGGALDHLSGCYPVGQLLGHDNDSSLHELLLFTNIRSNGYHERIP